MRKYTKKEAIVEKKEPTLDDKILESLKMGEISLIGESAESVDMKVDYEKSIESIKKLIIEQQNEAVKSLILSLNERWKNGIIASEFEALVEQYTPTYCDEELPTG